MTATMSAPALKTALASYGHTQPLKDGRVRPHGFSLDVEEVPVIIRAFRRMVRDLDFDICELAITTYLCARAYGKAMTAIPVSPMRAFHHGAILYNTNVGVRVAKDLEGRRVGVNRGYTVTTGVWARSILQHEHGVDLSKVTWVLSGDEHVAEFQPPPNVISIEPGTTLEQQLESGEIAAAIGIQVDAAHVKPLVPNAREAGLAALRDRNIYPINHTVVVRNDVLETNPDLPGDLFTALVDAKRTYVDALKAGRVEGADATHLRVMELIGDPLPYGIEPNRTTLEALMQYAVEQRIIPRPVAVEDLFAPSTWTLAG